MERHVKYALPVFAFAFLLTASIAAHARYDNNDALRDCRDAILQDRYGEPSFTDSQQSGIDNFVVRGTVQGGRVAFTCHIDDGRLGDITYEGFRGQRGGAERSGQRLENRRQKAREHQAVIACREYARARIDAFGGADMSLDHIDDLAWIDQDALRLRAAISADFQRDRRSFRFRCRVRNAEVERFAVF